MLRRYFGSERQIVLDYVNHKGERRDRRIVPYAVFFDISSYHPKEWVLNAWDLDKSEMRSFALSGIRGVRDARLSTSPSRSRHHFPKGGVHLHLPDAGSIRRRFPAEIYARSCGSA